MGYTTKGIGLPVDEEVVSADEVSGKSLSVVEPIRLVCTGVWGQNGRRKQSQLAGPLSHCWDQTS